MVETRIDLSEFLDGGFGHLIVDIEPPVKKNQYDRTRIFSWVQATQIGLDAFVDNQELVGFATELKTGKPVAGVEISIYPNGKIVSSQRQQSTLRRKAKKTPSLTKQSWTDWAWSFVAPD
ncbi:MAG: hypothetical protein WKF71_07780 [Pyrinomonadaceae bacterium]